MYSYTKIPNVMILNSALNVYEKAVLMILMALKEPRPSHANLARWIGVSKETVNKTLKSLKRKNVIYWKKGNGIYRQANYYFVHEIKHWKIKKTTLGARLHQTLIQERYIDQNPDSYSEENLERMIREYESSGTYGDDEN